MSEPNPLADLARFANEERSLRRKMQLAADEARSLGSTWQEIADASGITRQVAHKRWSEKGRASNQDYQQRLRRDARGELPFDPSNATKFEN